MDKELVAGVIVTFNRKVLLSENLKKQFIQRKKLNKIIIIDNASTDNTYEYLKSIFSTDELSLIIYIKLDINIGCAAAFSMGMKECFDRGYDWVYIMDDDGKPMDEETIENLFDFIYKNNYTSKDLIIANSLILENNLRLSFKLYESFSIENAMNHKENGILLNQAKMWNGTLISKGVFHKIGTPNALFGFKGEEVDYKARALKSGVLIFTVPSSRYQHPMIKEETVKFLWKTFFFSLEPDWKYYYIVRNRIYMLWKEHRYLRAFLFYYKFIYCMKKLSPTNYSTSIVVVKRAFKDGKSSNLGLVKDL